MPQSAQITTAVQRCNEAWQKVRNQLPPDADRHALAENNELCRWAFLDQLPILSNPESFQEYIACIAHGVVLGVIDLVDAGRYCHLAHSAIAAWKLANPPRKKEKHTPLPPNGNHLEDEIKRGAPGPSHLGTREGCETLNQPPAELKNTHPLPPNGNRFEQDQDRIAKMHLPNRKTQDRLYKSLRQHGIPVPSHQNLGNHPMIALYLCDLAQNHLHKLPAIEHHLAPQVYQDDEAYASRVASAPPAANP